MAGGTHPGGRDQVGRGAQPTIVIANQYITGLAGRLHRAQTNPPSLPDKNQVLPPPASALPGILFLDFFIFFFGLV